MTALIVVDHPEEWPLTFAAAEVISADAYLRDERLAGMRQARVYNLCDSYDYQTAGYYVSLLAAARGHRTMPGVATIQDVKSRSLLRADDELEELIERSLHTIKSKRFELSIYFGCNLAERHAASEPRAVQSVSRAADAGDVREVLDDGPVAAAQHRADPGRRHAGRATATFLRQVIENHFARRGPAGRAGPQRPVRARSRDPDERRRALAAVEPRGAEALRAGRARATASTSSSSTATTTAASPSSTRCSSARRRPSTTTPTASRAGRAPKGSSSSTTPSRSSAAATRCTWSSSRSGSISRSRRRWSSAAARSTDEIIRELGLPCVLKQPDSAFSRGRVPRRHARGARGRARSGCCRAATSSSCSRSCRRSSTGASASSTASRCSSAATSWPKATGRSTTTARSARRKARPRRSPCSTRRARCCSSRCSTANAIGDGFYGVDIKTVNGRHVLMEINDNPNVDRGVEDAVLGDELYDRIMKGFRARVDAGKQFKPAALTTPHTAAAAARGCSTPTASRSST